MAKHRIKKYSRRTYSQYKKSRAPIVLSVIAFLLLSVIISVLVGISLGKRAEGSLDNTKFDFAREEYDSNGKKVGAVEAYNFPKGASAANYAAQHIDDLSVCIRHRDGSIDYHFETADKYGTDEMDSWMSFSSLCNDAHKYGVRVCAYIYISSFGIEDEYLADIQKAYETALIREASEAGADHILLMGISVTEENLSEVEGFVMRAANASEKAPLGVAVTTETLDLCEDEIYVAARLRNACDYLALDLTHLTVEDGEGTSGGADGALLPSLLEKTLEKYEYYIQKYPMRILFSREDSKLYIPALKMGVVDLQIVAE